jgi:hypothetical protein
MDVGHLQVFETFLSHKEGAPDLPGIYYRVYRLTKHGSAPSNKGGNEL